MKANLLFIVLVFCGFMLFSQENFGVTSSIHPVSKTGYYKLLLSPEFRAYSQVNFRDVRLFNKQGIAQAYVLKKQEWSAKSSKFTAYQILQKNNVKNKYTELILLNDSPKAVSNISLQIANADVNKTYAISGSNDRSQWFAISDKTVASSLYDNEQTSVYKTFNFPPVQYRYFKIILNDSLSLPINILKAGYFQELPPQLSTQALPCKQEIIQNKQSTLIKVDFERSNEINQIKFDFENQGYFYRAVTIYSQNKVKRKKRTVMEKQELASFYIGSELNNSFSLSGIHQNEIYIEISNGDNPPLSIKKIHLEQFPVYLLAYLDSSEQYTLKTQSPSATKPQYDLNNWNPENWIQLPDAQYSELVVKNKKESSPKNGILQSKWIIWLSVGIGALVLFYVTYSLLKDIQKNASKP